VSVMWRGGKSIRAWDLARIEATEPLHGTILGRVASGASDTIGSSPINQAAFLGSFFKLTRYQALDSSEQKQNNVPVTFQSREAGVLKIFVEEAAALASIALFVGMIAVWAQLIPQL
jgi:hypothetical protein